MIDVFLQRIAQKMYEAYISYPHAKFYYMNTDSMMGLISSALVNFVMEPSFLCIFTPQVILSVMALPYFVFGIFMYRNTYTIAIIVLLVIGISISFNNNLTEAFVRHRLCVEMIYYSIAIKSFMRFRHRS